MAVKRRPLPGRARAPGGSGPVVLVVAFPDSIHTARWLNMVRGRGFRFVLLPAYVSGLSAELGRARPVRAAGDLAGLSDAETGVFDLAGVDPADADALDDLLGYHQWRPQWLPPETRFARPAHVETAIRELRPALVHAMQAQFGGYPCLAARQHLGAGFPPWLLSNWGSDIMQFRKLPEHQPRLMLMAGSIDAYLAECERDVGVVRQMGFRGMALPPMPASGGIDFRAHPALDTFAPPSRRREILIKGYHGWAGRALHVLAAIHLAAPALGQYALRITLAGPEVREMAAAIAEWDGLDIACEPYLPDHRDAMRRLGRARMAIGLSASDGISTTLLEAMSVGTFPIQSTASCGCEWVVPGRTGMLVSPHDVAALAEAIRIAATDDALVDAAAADNRKTVEARWNAATNGELALAHYRSLLREPAPSGVAASPRSLRSNGPVDA